jgi:hypothetical protein
VDGVSYAHFLGDAAGRGVRYLRYRDIAGGSILRAFPCTPPGAACRRQRELLLCFRGRRSARRALLSSRGILSCSTNLTQLISTCAMELAQGLPWLA